MRFSVKSEIPHNEDGSNLKNVIRFSWVSTIEGKEIINGFEESNIRFINELKNQISCYDKNSLFMTWFNFVRMVEEFINIRYELSVTYTLFAKRIHIGRKSEMDIFTSAVKERFGQKVMKHFEELVEAFLVFDFTIDELWLFLQKRRLHIMTILNLIPIYAKGNYFISPSEISYIIRKWIDDIMMNITAGCQNILVAKCLPNFYIKANTSHIRYSYNYTHLENEYLEPRRLSIVDLEKYRSFRFKDKKSINTKSICSLEEYDVNLYNDTLYYKKYGILQDKRYQSLVAFMNDMKGYFKDEYLIEVPQKDFEQIRIQYGELDLYKEMDDFYDILNSRYGFVKYGNTYYSTFFMLTRYYENYLERILRRNKTFQIDSGYVFEEKVKEIVAKYGYIVQKDCKRINHKEFDVVCVKDGTIFNFQCKNNYLNVASIGIKENDVARVYNGKLIKYYEGALQKEKNREKLLMKKLGINIIKHLVVSRFPVITDNESIIPFNRLEEWLGKNNGNI